MYYYQIGIRTKSNILRSRFDVTDLNEIIIRYVAPYAESKDIVLGGTKIRPNDVDTFYIMRLDISISSWVAQMQYRYGEEFVNYENNDIFDYPEYNFFDDIYEQVLNDLQSIDNKNEEKIKAAGNSIFVVYGHDEKMLLDVENFVLKIGYNPIILKNEANKVQTIIEKLENNSDVCYAIVLYSPCDKGFDINKPNEIKDRARQNVVFEHGYLFAKLSRKKVCALVQDGVETPGDLSGVVYIQYKNNWKVELARELKSAGLSISDNWM